MTERRTSTPQPKPASVPAPATKKASRARKTSVSGTTKAAPAVKKTTSKRVAAPRPATTRTEKPRRVVLGDTSGSIQPDRIRKHVVSEAVAARQVAQLAAVNDIVSHPESSKAEKAVSLRAILEGASPDEDRKSVV